MPSVASIFSSVLCVSMTERVGAHASVETQMAQYFSGCCARCVGVDIVLHVQNNPSAVLGYVKFICISASKSFSSRSNESRSSHQTNLEMSWSINDCYCTNTSDRVRIKPPVHTHMHTRACAHIHTHSHTHTHTYTHTHTFT